MNSLEKLLKRMERKYGHLAINNLSLYIVVAYGLGFVLQLMNPTIVDMMELNPYLVLHGQVWRIVTFLFMPPDSNPFFIFFVLLFYYSICQSLEYLWGAFRFNVYYFTGVIGTIVGSFILYFLTQDTGIFMNTYYLNLSLFLAFAASFPDMVVLFMFILPVKMKWLGLLDLVYLGMEFYSGDSAARISIVVAMLNFVFYLLIVNNFSKLSPKEIKRKQQYRAKVRQFPQKTNTPRHRCHICGKTELDDPNLEFRYCSKCEGDYEYCQEHLFTHTHIKK